MNPLVLGDDPSSIHFHGDVPAMMLEIDGYC